MSPTLGTKKQEEAREALGRRGTVLSLGVSVCPGAGTGRASQKCGWGRTGELRARLLWSTELPVRMGITVTRWTVG